MVEAYPDYYLLSQRKRNEEMWIQGAYIANAVSVALNNGFNKHKIDYLKKPLDIYPKTAAEEQEEIRQTRLRLVQQLSLISAQFKKSQKGTDQHGES